MGSNIDCFWQAGESEKSRVSIRADEPMTEQVHGFQEHTRLMPVMALALTLWAPKPMAIPETPPTARSGCTFMPITCISHPTHSRPHSPTHALILAHHAVTSSFWPVADRKLYCDRSSVTGLTRFTRFVCLHVD